MENNKLSFVEKIFQTTPTIWKVDLSDENTSALLQVLKLQTVKRPVELRGWPEDENKLRDFLLFLPNVPKLR